MHKHRCREWQREHRHLATEGADQDRRPQTAIRGVAQKIAGREAKLRNCARNVASPKRRCEVGTHCELLLCLTRSKLNESLQARRCLMTVVASGSSRRAFHGSSPTRRPRPAASTPTGWINGQVLQRLPARFAAGPHGPFRGKQRSTHLALQEALHHWQTLGGRANEAPGC